MSKDLQEQLDELRAEVQQLAQAIQELRGETPARAATPPQPARMPAAIDDERMIAARALIHEARENGSKGLITSIGAYDSHGHGYHWNHEKVPVEVLLDQDDEKVTRVLSAIGNKQRLALLKAILDQPASATELVERLGMGTTGQVYHHLKALQAADLVTQEERGQFTFVGHRAPGFLMLLAGIYDLLDTRYSAGSWEELPTT